MQAIAKISPPPFALLTGSVVPAGCRLAAMIVVSGVLAACSTGSAEVVGSTSPLNPSALNSAPDAQTGKASKAAASTPSLMPQFGPKVKARSADAAYQLSPDELKLDCKKLTGKIQVRLLQVRDERERTLTSKTAQAIQSTVVPVLGGSPYGANPADDFKRDRAWLEAYNAQLAAKNCPTYNLENELQPRSIRDTPQPVPKVDTPKTGKAKT